MQLQPLAPSRLAQNVLLTVIVLQVRQRLQKLEFYFEFLRVMSEDCRQRMLCEVMRDPGSFYPLSSVLEDAVR
jgi:hypothetical protein